MEYSPFYWIESPKRWAMFPYHNLWYAKMFCSFDEGHVEGLPTCTWPGILFPVSCHPMIILSATPAEILPITAPAPWPGHISNDALLPLIPTIMKQIYKNIQPINIFYTEFYSSLFYIHNMYIPLKLKVEIELMVVIIVIIVSSSAPLMVGDINVKVVIVIIIDVVGVEALVSV